MRAGTKFLLVPAMLIAACGGLSDGTSTTGVDETTVTRAEANPTTLAAESEDDQGNVGEISDFDGVPAECVEAFTRWLEAMERALAGFEVSTATVDDLEALVVELQPVWTGYEQATKEFDCPDLDTTEGAEAFGTMLDGARRDAPRTFAYIEWLAGFAPATGPVGAGATGDCESDIAALGTIIDEHESLGSLTPTETSEFRGLAASIYAACTTDRAEEFFSQEAFEAFMGE